MSEFEALEEETQEAAPEAELETTTEESGEPSLEERAKARGWTAKEDFKGDLAKWVPADQFIERAETQMPALRMQLDRLEKQLAQSARTTQLMAEHQQREILAREAEAFQRGIDSIKAQQRAAVEAGDAEEWERLETVKDTIRQSQEAKRQTAQPAAPQEQGYIPPAIEEWGKRNAWFEKDAFLANIAVALNQGFAQENPNLPDADRLLRVEREVKRRFPERFTNPNLGRPSGMETPRTPPSKPKPRTYDALPADYKRACDAYVASSKGKVTRDDYLKYVPWQEIEGARQ